MITGIDVATPQRNLNWDAVPGAGIRACYVKLGGDNVGRYVAPYYRTQVDRSRSKGLITGHYWVPGGDPGSAAAYFAANVHNRQGSDFFVLDNEALDDGRLYSDAEAALWLREVASRLGVGMGQMFMYIGAADLRARTWPQCESLGIKVIVASYGANNGYRDHEPNMGGRFGNIWAGHQYTSQGNVGGVTIDLNLFQDWAFNSEDDFLMALPQDLQQRISNDTIETVQKVREIQLALDSISKRLGPISEQWNFDWLPAISGNVGSAMEMIKALAEKQGVDLDTADVDAISNQVTAGIQSGIENAVKQAIIDAIPNQDALTKEDVIEAIKSVTFTAQ